MIRNIPNKYTQSMLIDLVNETHKGTYDFLYLRMDFKNKCNVGYAFINFTHTKDAVSFALRVCGKKWSKFNSEKVCSMSYANIQGRDALIKKFRDSQVFHIKDLCRAKLISKRLCLRKRLIDPNYFTPRVLVVERKKNFLHLSSKIKISTDQDLVVSRSLKDLKMF